MVSLPKDLNAPPKVKETLPGPVDELRTLFGNDFVTNEDGDKYDEARWLGKGDETKGFGYKTKSWRINTVGFPSCILTCDSVEKVQAAVKYYVDHVLSAGKKRTTVSLNFFQCITRPLRFQHKTS